MPWLIQDMRQKIWMGSSLERVLRYWTVRDRFNGVEETLANIGVQRVEVKPEGLLFVMDS